MKRSDPISVTLHLLVHLARHQPAPLTSAQLASCRRTNPVVIRRALATLRRAALVQSSPGHGGGWTLARPPNQITLREVYDALGVRLLAEPATGSPGCQLEAAVNCALTDVYQDAERTLAARLQQITLADLHHEMLEASPGRDQERNVQLEHAS